MGEEFVTAQLPDFLAPILGYLGMGAHFNNIGRGLIDSRDIVYYLTIIGFFLFLNFLSVGRVVIVLGNFPLAVFLL